MTPELARREAKRLLGAIASGEDPAAHRKAEARAMTLAALCDLYLVEGASHKKPLTLKAYRGRIKNHIVLLLEPDPKVCSAGSLRVIHRLRDGSEALIRDVDASG